MHSLKLGSFWLGFIFSSGFGFGLVLGGFFVCLSWVLGVERENTMFFEKKLIGQQMEE